MRSSLSERDGAPAVTATSIDAVSADLHYRGFSAATIDTTREQPESFDYSRVNALSNWNPTAGNYTRLRGRARAAFGDG